MSMQSAQWIGMVWQIQWKIELKWDKSAIGAIKQIKEKCYGNALRDYSGILLLVGINYNKSTKKHECIIESVQK